MLKHELCTPCAELYKDAYDMRQIPAREHKVTCARCNKRRYGQTYELTPKRKAVK